MSSEGQIAMSAKASLSFDIYLRATPQRVRAVLADPGLVPRWLAGVQFQPRLDLRRLTCECLTCECLACEWLQSGHLEANGGSASVVRFESVTMGQVTRLTVTYGELAPGGSFLNALASGWPMIHDDLAVILACALVGHAGAARRLSHGAQLARLIVLFGVGGRFLAWIAGLAWGAWATTPVFRGLWATTPERPGPARGACGPQAP